MTRPARESAARRDATRAPRYRPTPVTTTTPGSPSGCSDGDPADGADVTGTSDGRRAQRRPAGHFPKRRRWIRVLRSSLRCFFLAMRLRRFLTTEPILNNPFALGWHAVGPRGRRLG